MAEINTAINIASLTHTVLWAAFTVAVVFGFIGNRTNFCTMGAVSDVVNMGDYTRLRMWSLAAGVAVLAMGGFAFFGWVDPLKSIYTSPRVIWASYMLGGVLFGIGMVLASGCGSKTLFRIGGGSLKSLVVFIVLGIAAFATLKGITAVLRVNTVDALVVTLPNAQSLPALLGASSPLAALMVAAGVGAILVAFGVWSADARSANALLGGLGIGACVAATWFVSGKLGYLVEDPNTLQEAFLATNSGRAESLSFVSPIAYSLDWLMFFSDKSKVLTIGIISVVGTIIGSAISAYTSRSFRWESFSSAEDMANHLVGGVLMGVGGVTALGCTVGQGLSGISTLAVGSFLATAFIIFGAIIGVRYQAWRVSRS
jgi:uncharacterized protein